MSKITFTPLGGAEEIGANSYIVRKGRHSVLLDCGVHPKKDGVEALPDFSLLDDEPNAALISHAHIDHCGGMPYLLKECASISKSRRRLNSSRRWKAGR